MFIYIELEWLEVLLTWDLRPILDHYIEIINLKFLTYVINLIICNINIEYLNTNFQL